MTKSFERTLSVEGTFNFRDVGHYPARDGCTTRPGVLYRSGALHDFAPIAALGIRTVLDLRGAHDIERDAGPLGSIGSAAGVERVANPLIPPLVAEQTGHEYLNERFGSGISAERYQGYLEIGAERVRSAFEALSTPEVFPAVVHCTAGKDRTGVIIALVLDLLGVAHETIVTDYEMSNAAMPDLVAHLRGEPRETADLSESDLARFGAPAPAMRGFLAHVEKVHGSARGLLTSLGVGENVFETLEAVLLTKD